MKAAILSLVVTAYSLSAATYAIDVFGTISSAQVYYPPDDRTTPINLGSSDFRFSFTVEASGHGRVGLNQISSAEYQGFTPNTVCVDPSPNVNWEACPEGTHWASWHPPEIGMYRYTDVGLASLNVILDQDAMIVESIGAGFSTKATRFSLGLSWQRGKGGNWQFESGSIGADFGGLSFGNGLITGASMRNLAPVPEPSAFLLAAPALLLVLWRQRHIGMLTDGRRK